MVNSAAKVFDDVIGQCLAKTPGERPSADELSSSFEIGAAAPAALGHYITGLQEVSARREDDTQIISADPKEPHRSYSPPPAAPSPSLETGSSWAPISEVGRAVPDPAPATGVGMAGPRIEFVEGGRVISIVSIVGPNVRIGRSTDNHIVVDDEAVSRYACVIMRGETVIVAESQHTYYLRELNTANGILLNSQRVSTVTELHDNDVLTLGSTQLRFRVR